MLFVWVIRQANKRRLLETNPEIQRDEVIAEHVNSTKPTVLISPSLHTGLDLKDDLSKISNHNQSTLSGFRG
jgi:ATP-dependent DNA helicase DinG